MSAQPLLYQFELCPYCNKAKAGLELRGISYEAVEVNPMNKKEIAHVDPDENGRKKVPILGLGETHIRESSVILRTLDGIEAPGPKLQRLENEEQTQRIDAIEKWLDDHFMLVLPSVLYGSWGQAFKAAKLTAAKSNFGPFDKFTVNYFGSAVMKLVAKKTFKRLGEGPDPMTRFAEGLGTIEAWLEDDYLVGNEVSLADAAIFGALKCIEPFPAFEVAMARPKIKAWYARVDALRHVAPLEAAS